MPACAGKLLIVASIYIRFNFLLTEIWQKICLTSGGSSPLTKCTLSDKYKGSYICPNNTQESPIMFKQADVPPELWDKVNALQLEVVNRQKCCFHEWVKVMQYNPDYSPYVDRRNVGGTVIKEFHCPKCNLRKSFNDSPIATCHKCGGTMRYDRVEQCDMDRVHVYKCAACDHEYDTT